MLITKQNYMEFVVEMIALAAVPEPGFLAFDFETTGLDPLLAKPVGLAMAWHSPLSNSLEACYIPLGHQLPLNPILGWADITGIWEHWEDQVELTDLLKVIRPIFGARPELIKVAHNAKYDVLVAGQIGLEFDTIEDSMILASIVLPNRRHGLKGLVKDIFNYEMVEFEDLIKVRVGRKIVERSIRTLPCTDVVDPTTGKAVPNVARYAEDDARYTYRLYQHLKDKLDKDTREMRGIYHNFEKPLVPITCKMQRTGVKLDQPYLQRFADALKIELGNLEREFGETVKGVGIGSDEAFSKWIEQQIGRQQFAKYSHPVKKGHFSVAGDYLNMMVDDVSLPPKLRRACEVRISYMSRRKLLNTYVGSYLGYLPMYTDGRVHAAFDQRGAATGRFSSYGPNLQNIPHAPFQDFRVRRAIIAPDGYKVVSIDYSQIELRLFSVMAGETAMIEAFRAGQDIHAATAAKLFKVELEQVTKAMRGIGKTINFAIIYGASAGAIAYQAGIPFKEADQHLTNYHQIYPGIKRYMAMVEAEVAETGYATTLFGRRRPFNKEYVAKGGGRNSAINSPIQGTAADIIKLAMVDIDKWMVAHPQYGVEMIMQVHDELVFYVPDEYLGVVIPQLAELMTGVYPLAVPLEVDCEIGQNWYDMGTYEVRLTEEVLEPDIL